MNGEFGATTLNKWRSLTKLLESLTKKGKLKWRETSNDDEFLTSHAGIVVVLRQTTSVDTPEDLYVVSLRNKQGKVIDVFDDELLDRDQTETNYFMLLKELMLGIRRNMSGADEALDELLQALSEEDQDLPF
ncbi:hypothetical protein C1J03_19795 [Sulfitobacter sp. SK012]|uniref:hypothetical protein n=1 Tax=Sulfitobacter sp. SK012 TaxID=1389005 RepID=UPI000E0BF6EC|nr:hypothetical protein [Sulfitobacter sp. SK012]AXI48046.1 hypothetical protein C1J03_19795 [Sulfitobacter sp. SK012]